MAGNLTPQQKADALQHNEATKPSAGLVEGVAALSQATGGGSLASTQEAAPTPQDAQRQFNAANGLGATGKPLSGEGSTGAAPVVAGATPGQAAASAFPGKDGKRARIVNDTNTDLVFTNGLRVPPGGKSDFLSAAQWPVIPAGFSGFSVEQEGNEKK